MSLELFSDRYTYWLLQGAFSLVFIRCAMEKSRNAIENWLIRRKGGSTANLYVQRREKTLAKYAGFYAAAAVIVLTIDGYATPIEGYRVFWISLHTVMMVYLFFWNGHFRRWMQKLEEAVYKVKE
jgi:hypothetical protein